MSRRRGGWSLLLLMMLRKVGREGGRLGGREVGSCYSSSLGWKDVF